MSSNVWVQPIVDRTQADVDYADANRGNLTPNKGARNGSDLERITGNLRYLRDELTELGYTIPPLISLTEWPMDFIPRYSDIDKIRVDVQTIRNVGLVSPHTPHVPPLPYLAYQKLNDIEKILFDVNTIMEGIPSAFIYSDEIQSGEGDFV